MAVNWPQGVTSKAYGMSLTGAQNTETVSFESGMKRTYQKDLRGKAQASLTFSMPDDGSSTCPFRVWWSWYMNTLLQGAKTFYFPDIITHTTLTEYRLASAPTVRGQNPKTVTITVEEA